MTAYTDALAWLNNAPTNVMTLAGFAELTNAVKALAPPPMPTVHAVPFDLRRVLTCLWSFSGHDRYTRDQLSLVVTTDTLDIPLAWTDMSAGGVVLRPAHPSYGLWFAPFVGDDTLGPQTELLRFTAPATSFPSARVTFPTTWADGDYMLGFTAYDAAGNVTAPLDAFIPLLFQLNRHNTPQTHLLFQDNSYDWAMVNNLNPAGVLPATTSMHWARVPIRLNKTRPTPLAVRNAVPFSTQTTPAQMFLRYLVPLRPGSTYRPVIDKNGRWSTCNHQGYYPGELRCPWPTVPQIDGPHGIATGNMATTMAIGHNGGVYATEGAGCCFVHYQPTGQRQTLLGWVDDVAPYLPGDPAAGTSRPTGNPPGRRLVGDWSAVTGYKGLLNSWGWCWDNRTTVQGKPTNKIINGDPVHDADVTAYFFDRADGGRMLSVTWWGQDPARGTPLQTPGVVRVLLTGLGDPWGAAFNDADGFVYVCIRDKHAIIKIAAGATAATIVGTFVQGKPLGTFSDSALSAANWAAPFYRFYVPKAGVTLAQVQAEPCQGPECIRIKGGYVAWSSFAQQDVRRSKDGAAIEVLCHHPMTNKSHFLIFDFGDGSFGPDGTVFTSSYDEQRFGRPRAWVSGKEWAYQGFVSRYVHTGAGGQWSSLAYSMSCAVRFGRLVFGSSEEGLGEITLAMPGEVAPDLATMNAQGQDYTRSGNRMVFGHQGASMIDASMTNAYLSQP